MAYIIKSTQADGRLLNLLARIVISRRTYSTSNEISSLLTQKELREKAVADALAREEEAASKAKALRELKVKVNESITTLNKTPSNLLASRLQKLQSDLDQIDRDKVKQLDEELEDFMFQQMKLPAEELINRPWAMSQSASKSVLASDIDESSQKLSSTASMSYMNQYPNLKPTLDYKSYSEQELYLRQLAHARDSGTLGSKLKNIYKAREEVRNPHEIQKTTISTLLAAGCHLGHSKTMWRPSTQPYIYGEYDGIHLIDLNETITALKRACQVIKGVSKKGGIILYVGTSRNWEQQRALEEAANRSNAYYVSKRWIPGMVTNFVEVTKQIKQNCKVELDMSNKPTNRELGNDEDGLIKPDLVVILNPVENRNCINECIKLRIPTIGLCDTDMEPSLLSYPVPCNDDSTRASSLMVGILSKSAEEGLRERISTVNAFKINNRNLHSSKVRAPQLSTANA